MNAEKVMVAIGKIDDKYIEENAIIKPVKHDEIDRMVRARGKWFSRACACIATVALALGIGIGISSLNNNMPLSSFALTAYARADDGSMVEKEVTDSIQLPISVVETEDGLKGFLFSIESPNTRNAAPVTVVTNGGYEEIPFAFFKVSGIELKQDKVYFYFAGADAENPGNVSFSYTDEKEENTIEVVIQITETEEGYYAKLQELNTYPSSK